MADLILELYSEELPVSAQISAEQGFKPLFAQFLEKNRIPFTSCSVFSGPCRITIYVEGLPIYVNQDPEIIKGPKIGAPQDHIEGFCRKYEIDFDLLREEGEHFFYHKAGLQQECRVILTHIIPEILGKYVWSTSMRWGEHNCLWPRPLKNILCLFGGRVLHFSYHHLESNNLTFGHKFLSKNKNRKQAFLSKIEVNNWNDYTLALENNGVVLDQKDRIQSIKEQAFVLLEDAGLKRELCPNLLMEAACNVELPFVMLGKIAQAYMSLPDEIIVTVMRVHQKYFPTYYGDSGLLAPYFLFVSNCDPNEDILRGNEGVLRARLADAYFLYKKDLQVSIEQRYEQLSKVAFHAKLGSIQDKSIRLEQLTNVFSMHLSKADQSNFALAAKFCKCDLVGDVVSDLATLEGHMAYRYAIVVKYDLDAALAMRDHYKPAGLKDSLPSTNLGLCLSLIDKIDSLVGMYIAGERSTGNKDPYGLRRFALGIIRVFAAKEFSIEIELETLIRESIKLYGVQESAIEVLKQEILDFIKLRHKNLLKADFDNTIINSVIDFSEYDIASAYQKSLEVQKFVSSSIFEMVSQSFKRVFNLVSANADLLSKARRDFCLNIGNVMSADSLIKAFGPQYSEDLNESSVICMLETLDSYDLSTRGQSYLLHLSNLEHLSAALNNFIDRMKISENLFRIVLLSEVLERFNSVVVFERLNS
jgi:glycyl-tRNA synthetase beta chain